MLILWWSYDDNILLQYVMMPKCKCKTSKGDPCKRDAEKGSKYCWQHKTCKVKTTKKVAKKKVPPKKIVKKSSPAKKKASPKKKIAKKEKDTVVEMDYQLCNEPEQDCYTTREYKLLGKAMKELIRDRLADWDYKPSLVKHVKGGKKTMKITLKPMSEKEKKTILAIITWPEYNVSAEEMVILSYKYKGKYY